MAGEIFGEVERGEVRGGGCIDGPTLRGCIASVYGSIASVYGSIAVECTNGGNAACENSGLGA
eukprot:2088642-Rhodomonas_salina.3